MESSLEALKVIKIVICSYFGKVAIETTVKLTPKDKIGVTA